MVKRKPKVGYLCYRVTLDGDIERYIWSDSVASDNRVLAFGNIFATLEEADNEIERRFLVEELREYSSDFTPQGDNYYITYNYDTGCVDYLVSGVSLGTLCFDSAEALFSAVDSVGVDRVIRYYLGIDLGCD